jgi:hypothetical protein
VEEELKKKKSMIVHVLACMHTTSRRKIIQKEIIVKRERPSKK